MVSKTTFFFRQKSGTVWKDKSSIFFGPAFGVLAGPSDSLRIRAGGSIYASIYVGCGARCLFTSWFTGFPSTISVAGVALVLKVTVTYLCVEKTACLMCCREERKSTCFSEWLGQCQQLGNREVAIYRVSSFFRP